MRNVIITGATGGIGSAVSLRFAREKDRVFLGYAASEEKARQDAAHLHENGYEAIPLPLDVTDETSVRQAFRTVEQEFGGADILINNAGKACAGLFQDIREECAREILEVNLAGAERCIAAAVPSMIKKQQGAIVNITSIWGEVGGSCEAHYSAAKAGLIGLTRALAKELGPSGIRVNAVSPGVIRTRMLDCYDGETLRELAQETPLGRLGTPCDVAEAVLFLCGEEASFITGQVLGVDGGFGR